ncbi:hypothetical protein [Streptosporangium subroseum]|uniref:hypothetical protein n=1 Tax=Streptosporangium subroseum TaxID=106412 RepID=UPI00308EF2FD|nr:hypothetical protein OHB15_46335 [Streptosporangium subroseum]
MEQVEPKKWQNLPERVTFDQMTSAQPSVDVPNPEAGRPTELDAALRLTAYGA